MSRTTVEDVGVLHQCVMESNALARDGLECDSRMTSPQMARKQDETQNLKSLPEESTPPTSLAPGSRYNLSSIITDSSTKNDTTKSCETNMERVRQINNAGEPNRGKGQGDAPRVPAGRGGERRRPTREGNGGGVFFLIRALRTLKSSAPIVTSCSVIPTTTRRGATMRCSRRSPSSTRSINICRTNGH